MLDEPTAGVSPIVMDELFDRIIEVARTGIPILMVEQNARQALEIADKAMCWCRGGTHTPAPARNCLLTLTCVNRFWGGEDAVCMFGTYTHAVLDSGWRRDISI